MAELRDFALAAQSFYKNVRPQEVRVLLAHSDARILPEIGESLAEYALNKLMEKGVEVRLNTRVTSATAELVDLKPRKEFPPTH